MAAAGVDVGVVRACTDVAGWFLLALELVVSIADASETLGAFIEAEVLGDLEAFLKEGWALQGILGVGGSNDGEYRRGGCMPPSVQS